MEKIAVLSANFGSFDPPSTWVKQSVPVRTIRMDDNSLTVPWLALEPRLRARIPKMLGWFMFPEYEYYIWVDASFGIENKNTVKWLLDSLGDKDMAVFLHPDRKTIREEVEFVEGRIADGNKYLASRYDAGVAWRQLEDIEKTDYVDDRLYASYAFVYRYGAGTTSALMDWWLESSLCRSLDQVMMPFILRRTGISIAEISENAYKTPYLTYTRNKKKAA